MLKNTFPVAVLVCLCVACSAFADDPNPQAPKPKDVKPATVGMRVKLDLSKQILSGLATADFQQIAESAKAMQALNSIERFTRGTGKYQAQLRIFQFATKELVRCGEEENLEGATLAYTTMTTSCVACHKQLRNTDN